VSYRRSPTDGLEPSTLLISDALGRYGLSPTAAATMAVLCRPPLGLRRRRDQWPRFFFFFFFFFVFLFLCGRGWVNGTDAAHRGVTAARDGEEGIQGPRLVAPGGTRSACARQIEADV